MKTYRPRKLIDGYKVDPEYSGKKLIAIPEKKLDEAVEVRFEDGIMQLKNSDRPLVNLDFDDKFGRGKYTLSYFEWKPEVQGRLL